MTSPSSSTPRGVLTDLARAWNAGDATVYAALFTTTASYVTFDGRLLEGRQAIEDVHRFLFDGPLRGSRMASTGAGDGNGDTIRSTPLRDDVAVLVSTGGIRLAGQSNLGDRASVQTVVATREDGRWLVAAFQNTRIGADS